MKLYNNKLSGYFGKIFIPELQRKSDLYLIADQFQAEALNYSNFNKIGEYKGYRTILTIESEYYKIIKNQKKEKVIFI